MYGSHTQKSCDACCRQFIRTLPMLVYDESDVEDVDTDCEDHIYDETRYAAMERKIKPRENIRKPEKQYDPLEAASYREYTGF